MHVKISTKKDIVYSRGKSKSLDPYLRMISTSNIEKYLEYVPPGATTPIPASRATTGTPQKVVPSVVTTSQSYEEHTLSGSPFGATSRSKGASGFEFASASKSAYSSGSNADTASGSAS